MERKNNQKIRHVKTIAGVALGTTGSDAAADVLYFDEGYAQQIAVTQQNDFGTNTNRMYLLTIAGISSISGELEFPEARNRKPEE